MRSLRYEDCSNIDAGSEDIYLPNLGFTSIAAKLFGLTSVETRERSKGEPTRQTEAKSSRCHQKLFLQSDSVLHGDNPNGQHHFCNASQFSRLVAEAMQPLMRHSDSSCQNKPSNPVRYP